MCAVGYSVAQTVVVICSYVLQVLKNPITIQIPSIVNYVTIELELGKEI